EVPFNIEAKLIKDNEGGTVIARYEIKRAAGGTSYAEPLEFSVGVALDLTAPGIKEAPNGTSLDPFAAKEALTAVVPAFDNMVGTQLSVTWTGTAGHGSHTTVAITVTTQGPQNIVLPNSLVAHNLSASVTVTYRVIHNDTPWDSKPFVLAVLPIAHGDANLPTPSIDGAVGNELNVIQLADDAKIQIAKWPLQLSGQSIWLRYDGIGKTGSPVELVFWAGAAHHYTDGVVYAAQVAWLRELKDGSSLTITFKVNFNGVADAGTAVSFPIRTYIVKTVEDVKPEISKITGSTDEAEIPQGGVTVETAVTLSGVAANGQKVEVFDGNVSKGQATAHATTGVWTLLVTALAVAAHSFTARALYGSGASSAAWTLTVTAVVVPTLSNVLDDNNVEVPEGQTTVSTTLLLKGTASLGQKINIRDGTGTGSATRGTATAGLTTGLWECPITVPLGARRLYAEALYPSNPLYSNVRNLTVTPVVVPTLDNVLDDNGVVVPKNTNTLSTSLTLKGNASIGQKIEIFDGMTSTGEVTATSGSWEKLLTGLSFTSHTFTVKALYGAGDSSQPYNINVINYDIEDFEKCALGDIPQNLNYSTSLLTLKWQVTNPQGLLVGKIIERSGKQLYIFSAGISPGPQPTLKIEITLSTPCSRLSIDHNLIISTTATRRINYYNAAGVFLGFKDPTPNSQTNTIFSGSNIKKLEIIILGSGNMYFDNIKMEY
ncbi:hypothetical protein HU755_16775, partial [Pseudomonas sp. SWRI111]|nr:hypothetical protein [Pseudomonas sp. SWRI111]